MRFQIFDRRSLSHCKQHCCPFAPSAVIPSRDSPIKSQWCTLLFSSSGLFLLLYFMWVCCAVMRGGCVGGACTLTTLGGGAWYGGGGVRRGGAIPPPGEPGSELGGVSGGTYISRWDMAGGYRPAAAATAAPAGGPTPAPPPPYLNGCCGDTPALLRCW